MSGLAMDAGQAKGKGDGTMTKGKPMKVEAAKPGTATPSKPPHGAGVAAAVVSMNDETREELEAALGTKNVSFNTNLFARTSKTAFVFQGDGVHPGAEDALNQTATLVGIKGFKPTDPVEAMIAAQAVMLHNLALEAGRRAQMPQQNSDVASKLRKDAINASRGMVDMVDALARRRGQGSQQLVRVERVMVGPGGQAIVGSVHAGAPLPTPDPVPQALERGAAPMTAPVVMANAGEGEGA